MAIEAGGKSGIIAVDDITREFLSKVNLRSEPKIHYSDDGANYEKILRIDVSKLDFNTIKKDMENIFDKAGLL